MDRNVLIVGGGELGAFLADHLHQRGHRVTTVEISPQRAEVVRRATGQVVVDGSGTDADALERAGVRNCHVLVAVTGADETNLVVASLARFAFDVPRVIARVVRPGNAWLFGADMGVDVVLDEAQLLGQLVVDDLTPGEVRTLLKVRRGGFALVEEDVAPGAQAVGATVADLSAGERCTVVGVIRGDGFLSPRPGLVIEAGDQVLAMVHSDEADRLTALLRR